MNIRIFSFFLILVLFFSNSCKKKEIDNETNSILDFIICDQEFLRIPMLLNSKAVVQPGVLRINGNLKTYSASCPKDTLVGDTTWLSPLNLPGISMNYGAGCTDDVDGKTRYGKIETRFSKSFDSIGCVVTFVLTNYAVADLSFNGTIKLTKTGNHTYHYSVQNGQCTSSAWSISYNTERDLTWTTGFSNLLTSTEDVFEFTGTAEGVNREGRKFTVKTTSAVEKKADCKWIQKGVLEITPEGLKTRIIDFGNGTCDNEAVFSIDNKTLRFLMQQ
jgi:hypothetical protein